MPLNIDKIRTLREKLGMSLQDAAEKAGFNNRQQWHQVEKGTVSNPSIDTVQKMAKALGVTVDELLK